MSRDPALDRLVPLLMQQARRLGGLGDEPLAVASARNKFNDAFEDDYWCAVQLERYRWEQSQFFHSSHSDGFGSMTERGTVRLVPADRCSAEASASDVAAARAILAGLDRAGWHDLAAEALGRSPCGGILALVIQFDQIWLHCSHPMGHGDDVIYAVTDSSLLQLGSVDQRFDDMVGQAELISCEMPDQDVAAKLPRRARSQFDRRIHDAAAAADLAGMLVAAASRLGEMTRGADDRAPAVAVRLGLKYGEQRYAWDAHSRATFAMPSRFAIGTCYFDRNYFNVLRRAAERSPKAAERLKARGAPVFREVDEFIFAFDQAAVRRLFERATGVDTFDSDQLFFLLIESRPFLLHETRLYRVEPAGLAFAGNWPAARHEFSGEIGEWVDALPAVFRQDRGRLD